MQTTKRALAREMEMKWNGVEQERRPRTFPTEDFRRAGSKMSDEMLQKTTFENNLVLDSNE